MRISDWVQTCALPIYARIGGPASRNCVYAAFSKFRQGSRADRRAGSRAWAGRGLHGCRFTASPDANPQMLERWQAGAEMVYDVRATRDDESVFKRVGTRFFYKLMRTSGGLQVPENAGDFRLMDKVVVDALLRLPERRSEEHTSELQSLMRTSYAVFCLKKTTIKACEIGYNNM